MSTVTFDPVAEKPPPRPLTAWERRVGFIETLLLCLMMLLALILPNDFVRGAWQGCPFWLKVLVSLVMVLMPAHELYLSSRIPREWKASAVTLDEDALSQGYMLEDRKLPGYSIDLDNITRLRCRKTAGGDVRSIVITCYDGMTKKIAGLQNMDGLWQELTTRIEHVQGEYEAEQIVHESKWRHPLVIIQLCVLAVTILSLVVGQFIDFGYISMTLVPGLPGLIAFLDGLNSLLGRPVLFAFLYGDFLTRSWILKMFAVAEMALGATFLYFAAAFLDMFFLE